MTSDIFILILKYQNGGSWEISNVAFLLKYLHFSILISYICNVNGPISYSFRLFPKIKKMLISLKIKESAILLRIRRR